MTKEARKHAFKKSLACGPTTIVLTIILTYFLPMAKAAGAAPVDFATAAHGMAITVAITSIICCLIQYPIVGKEFKAQFEEGGEMLPAMGKREEQIQFFSFIPGNWVVYEIFFAIFAGIIFGAGIPGLLTGLGINPAGLGRIGFSVVQGVINGVGVWWAVYLCQIYLVQFFWEKAAAAQAAK